MVWPVLIALLAVVAIVLVYPLWWRSAQPLPVGLEDREAGQALADEQRRLLVSLRRLHYDYAEGRVTAADYRTLEAEYQQALALAMERQAVPQALSPAEPEQAAAPRKLFHRVGSLGVVLLLAVPAVTIFTPPSALDANGKISLEAVLHKLEKKLVEQPGDVENWTLAARTYEAMDKRSEARDAWSKVLTLQADHREAMFNLALTLIQSDDSSARLKGLAYLDVLLKTEPEAPVLLWYKGVALYSLERKQAAREIWLKLQATLPADGENARLVEDALKHSVQ